MSSLMPPEKRKLSSSGSPATMQATRPRVEDVVEALAERRPGRDHLKRLDEPGLLTALELDGELIPSTLRHLARFYQGPLPAV